MIELIRLANFQCHSRLEVVLDEKITTIAGPSDVGKSSILRALRWAALNNPQGDTFVREGAKGTTVQVHFDGHVAVRKRGGSLNTYELDGSEYKAFGSGVPDPIATAFNVTETNFQDQHDAAYWLSLSSGEVSRQLNAIVDLGVIDTTLANINSTVRTLQQKSTLLSDRVRQARERKVELEWVNEAVSAYAAVNKVGEERDAAQSKVAELRRTVVSAHSHLQTIKENQAKYSALAQVGKACRVALDAQEKSQQLSKLIKSAKGFSEKLAQSIPDITFVSAAIDAWKKQVERRKELDRVIQDVIAATLNVKKRRENYKAARSAVDSAGVVVCPTCSQPVEVE